MQDDNETWIIEAGDAVIRKRARVGFENLTPWERLVYCLWVADYGMRNAGDLQTGANLYGGFQSVALGISADLSLSQTREAFSLRTDELENSYFERFDGICNEIRNAGSTSQGDN